MFRQILVFSFCFSSFLNRGLALQCYACAGSKTSDCAVGKTTAMVAETCRNVTENINLSWLDNDLNEKIKVKTSCLNLVMSGFNPDLVVRGCGYVPKDADTCKFLTSFKQIKACKSCTTDFCNIKEDKTHSQTVSKLIRFLRS